MAVSYSNMPSKELTAALEAARAAADVIGAHYRKNPSVRTKPDDSPVTEADVRAEEGAGAWLNEQPVRVSDVAALAGAVVSTGNLKTLARSPRWQRLAGLIGRVSRIRGYGDFVHYHLLSRGALDVVIESDVNI